MEKEALLQDIDVVADHEEDTELKEFKCELLDQYGVYQKRNCVITTQFIEFYSRDNPSTPCFYNEIFNISAIYISRERESLLLKRSIPNIVLRFRNKPGRAVAALRCIYSVLYESEIPVYEVKEDDLECYLNDQVPPDERYLVPEETDEFGKVMTTQELMSSQTPDGMAGRIYTSSVKTKISQIEKKPESKAAQEEYKQKLIEESDSEEEGKFTAADSRAQSFNEDVDYDSDEDRANLLESECKLTGGQLKEFNCIARLGKGGYARVILCRDSSGNLFAMKRIRKDVILKQNLEESLAVEMRILSENQHPFILSLKHWFESELRYYFFLEFMAGRDLKYQMDHRQQGYKLSEVRFIGAQLILAIEHLHEKGYVHRDLKPENVLMSAEGYIKLADFGISEKTKDNEGKSNTGSVPWMSPEFILNTMYGEDYEIGKEVDWWAFGLIMYEIHFKHFPFMAGSVRDVADMIVDCKIDIPDCWETGRDTDFKNFKKLLKKLLRKEQHKRLSDSEDIKRHPFFSNVDFDKIYGLYYAPTYEPYIDPKLTKLVQRNGCPVGRTRGINDRHGRLLETDLPTEIVNFVKSGQQRFDRARSRV